MRGGSGANTGSFEVPRVRNDAESLGVESAEGFTKSHAPTPDSGVFVTYLLPAVTRKPIGAKSGIPIGARFEETRKPGALLSVKDVAEKWNVSTATVYTLAKNGKLRSLRVGNSLRFTEDAVEAYERARDGAPAERHLRGDVPADLVGSDEGAESST